VLECELQNIIFDREDLHYRTCYKTKKVEQQETLTPQSLETISSDIIQYILKFLPFRTERGTREYQLSLYFGKRNGELITMFPNISLEIDGTSWIHYKSLLEYTHNLLVCYTYATSLFNLIKPRYKYLESVELKCLKDHQYYC
jgi:hypothetical protein